MRALIILPITIALFYSPALGAEALPGGGSLSGGGASSQKKPSPTQRMVTPKRLPGSQQENADISQHEDEASSLKKKASAEKKWYYGFEISELNIKLASDGSGIIKEVRCEGCSYKFVKITPKTEVFVNGIKHHLLLARERAGKEVYIEFDTDTAEVKTINWAQ